jgi:membrane-associated protein
MDGRARDGLGERIARVPPGGRGARVALAALAIAAVGVMLGAFAVLEGDLPEDLTSVGAFVASLVRRYGVPACLALLYVEESGVPLPVPGDVYVVYIGTVSAGSLAKLAGAWLAIIAVVVGGATNLYLISRRWAHRLVTGRVGQLLHLDAERLAQVERWLRRWGALAIIFGRHVPGMRIPITVLAGAFEVPYRVFAPSVAVSTAIWAGVWLVLGARFGPSIEGVLTRNRSLYLAAIGAAVLLLAVIVVRAWRSSGQRRADEPGRQTG